MKTLTDSDHIKLALCACAPLTRSALYYDVRQQSMSDSHQIMAEIDRLIDEGHIVVYDEDPEQLDWTDYPQK